MTIREHYQRLFKRVKNVTVGVVVVLALAVLWFSPHLTGAQNARAAFLVGITIAGALLLALRGRFMCPRCGADLSKLRGQEARRTHLGARLFGSDRRQFWDEWDACPKCGVSFDEEWGPIS
jgi:ribosomal protein S27AE